MTPQPAVRLKRATGAICMAGHWWSTKRVLWFPVKAAVVGAAVSVVKAAVVAVAADAKVAVVVGVAKVAVVAEAAGSPVILLTFD
jgi:hypothetical protein